LLYFSDSIRRYLAGLFAIDIKAVRVTSGLSQSKRY
jgi:hypothetical protein